MCSQCLSRLARHSQQHSARRTLTSSPRFWSETINGRRGTSKALNRAYFSPHEPLARDSIWNGLLVAFSGSSTPEARCSIKTSPSSLAVTNESNSPLGAPIATENPRELPPHRRRKRLAQDNDNDVEPVIPPDASSQLSTLSSSLPLTSLRRKLATYLALTKPRLSFLILLTTTSAYGLYPISSLLTLDSSMAELPTLSMSTLTFFYLTAGTFLSASSANTLNMLFEPQYDARMSRTRNRPLVRGLLSARAALLFAISTGVTGLTLLYIGTNPTVAALSAFNIFLYAFVYTPLKRLHVINTWVGAIVGGIPPLMGWVAAAGQTATTGHDTWRDMLLSEDSIGGWLLASLLFAWQFPHFNSLSHTIREEYKAAGYKMMAWVNPARNARVALRYSILMFPISFGLWWVGIVNNGFLVGSTLANGWLVQKAYWFWKHQGSKGTARGLFWASVWQLPILMVGALVTKKGVWEGVWRRVAGGDEEGLYEDEEGENSIDSREHGGDLTIARTRA
ncbi:hypothetical protein Egran_03618 [Elaphomyces granulatus]|uniref:Protoheme IX farnesyltransferase, mitochondrial n=1 Tax=Elaphomyces granulatus TaxID=519963 RepID=A0A232LWR9_9EURO|nr:hypothetical protein Egran_03618 [Elaphomyces granulatus]